METSPQGGGLQVSSSSGPSGLCFSIYGVFSNRDLPVPTLIPLHSNRPHCYFVKSQGRCRLELLFDTIHSNKEQGLVPPEGMKRLAEVTCCIKKSKSCFHPRICREVWVQQSMTTVVSVSLKLLVSELLTPMVHMWFISLTVGYRDTQELPKEGHRKLKITLKGRKEGKRLDPGRGEGRGGDQGWRQQSVKWWLRFKCYLSI